MHLGELLLLSEGFVAGQSSIIVEGGYLCAAGAENKSEIVRCNNAECFHLLTLLHRLLEQVDLSGWLTSSVVDLSGWCG